jgi:hypothetical protein
MVLQKFPGDMAFLDIGAITALWWLFVKLDVDNHQLQSKPYESRPRPKQHSISISVYLTFYIIDALNQDLHF